MSGKSVRVRIPATTANLGPGFDCLALSLDLWNEMTFTLEGEGVQVEVQGEGQGRLPLDEKNLAARAFFAFNQRYQVPTPRGLRIQCRNQLPLGSGMGSSASATLAGMLAANQLAGKPAGLEEVLALATEMEGHPDNAAAALWGGLVVVVGREEGFLTRRFDVPELPAVVVLPDVDLPTQTARAALPASVPMKDAIYNLGRTALVVEALRAGDLSLLGEVMDDKLHQPYRLDLIPGARKALAAAKEAGAAACAISGAGPSLIAFGGDPAQVARVMKNSFSDAGVLSREWVLNTTNQGAQIQTLGSVISSGGLSRSG